jgi:hypothetical protein
MKISNRRLVMTDAEFCLMVNELWKQQLNAEAQYQSKWKPAPIIPVGSEPPPATQPERQRTYRQIMETRGVKFVPNTLGKQALDIGGSAVFAGGLAFAGTLVGCFLLGPFGSVVGLGALAFAGKLGLNKTRKQLTIT